MRNSSLEFGRTSTTGTCTLPQRQALSKTRTKRHIRGRDGHRVGSRSGRLRTKYWKRSPWAASCSRIMLGHPRLYARPIRMPPPPVAPSRPARRHDAIVPEAMRLEAGSTIDALRTARPCCLMCSRTEHYPQKLSGPEAQPRWKCPQRSGLLTWFALLTMPSATFFALVAPLLVGEIPAGILVSRAVSRPSCVG